MYKEIVIVIFIVGLVIAGDAISQGFTEKSVKDMNNLLDELKIGILNEEDTENTKTKLEKIEEEWEVRKEKMVYYLEHDELEKVSTQLQEIKGYTETKKTEESVPYIDNCKFLLEHIKEKEVFNFKNIF